MLAASRIIGHVCWGVIAVGGACASAQAYPRLVKDINRVPYLGQIGVSGMTAANGRMFFVGTMEDFGEELWVSDGSAKGTRMLRDLAPGRASGYPQGFTPMGGQVYFTAYDGRGYGVWRSDGTSAGTALVKDLTPAGVVPTGPVAASGSKVWFKAVPSDDDRPDAPSLWASDGTEAGTIELNPPAASGEGQPPVRPFDAGPIYGAPALLGGNLYFQANRTQIWRSDGTLVGNLLIATFAGGSHAQIVSIAATATRWFAIFNDGSGNSSLWTGDGEPGSAQQVGGPWDLADDLKASAGKVFFRVYPEPGTTEVWCSDGTASGTVLLAGSVPAEMKVAGDFLYFLGTADGGGGELWKSDGTVAGTVLVKDIRPGNVGSGVHALTAAGNGVYFSADDGIHGYELWFSDGSATGTRMVFESLTGAAHGGGWNMASMDDGLLFGFSDGDPAGLWITDRSLRGAKRISKADRVNRWGVSLYGPEAVANGRKLFFRADDGVHGQELWVSDSSARGTRMVVDLGEPIGPDSYPHFMTPQGSGVVFVATDKTSRENVWFSDGTRAGTRILTDFQGQLNHLMPHPFVKRGAISYFISPSSTNLRLWQTDGTVAGTAPVAGAASLFVESMAMVGNKLFFASARNTISVQLRTLENGSVSLVKSIPAANRPDAGRFTPVGNRLAFFIFSNGNADLWTSDGTEAGTVLVKEGWDWLEWSGTLGTVHLFIALDENSEKRIWRSDGTPEGTTVLAALTPVSGTNDYGPPVVAGGFIYFVADDGVHGLRLWRSDGTPQGTTMATEPDLRVGIFAGEMAAVGDRLYFSANDGSDGWQLWSTDGTPAGTLRVTTLSKRGTDPSPFMLTPADNRLYYGAYALGKGLELHVLDLGRR